MVRRLSADTAMLIGCAISWGIAVGLVQWLDASFGFRAFAWGAWDALPAGAILCGLVAGSGGFLGLALSRMRPTPLGVAFPALLAASIPAAFYWVRWYFGPAGVGPAPSDTVAFLPYLKAALADPDHHASLGALALQFLGAFAGGAVISVGIMKVDACPRCSELLSPAGEIERFVDDPGALARMNAAALDEPSYVSMLAALEKRSGGVLWVRTILKICKHCGMGEVVERRRRRAEGGWGRAAVRRKYGSRAPALVRWFMAPVNGDEQEREERAAPRVVGRS